MLMDDSLNLSFLHLISSPFNPCGTVKKCSILFKIKKGENFNHRNILNISRIES